jgi:LmbE family N-acetylglucosaminyl deacetylase
MTENKIVAVVVAHPDDEVLGCGGTVNRMANNGDIIYPLIVVEGATARQMSQDDRDDSSIAMLQDTAKKVAKILGTEPPKFAGAPDNRLDGIERIEITKIVEQFINDIKPAIIFTHHLGDLNVDHRRVHEAVITACRPLPSSSVQSIYAFETVSSTEWTPGGMTPFVPNRFVNITDNLEKKLEALDGYSSEMRPFPHARSKENVEALARFRGASVGLEAAEAFALIRQVCR